MASYFHICPNKIAWMQIPGAEFNSRVLLLNCNSKSFLQNAYYFPLLVNTHVFNHNNRDGLVKRQWLITIINRIILIHKRNTSFPFNQPWINHSGHYVFCLLDLSLNVSKSVLVVQTQWRRPFPNSPKVRKGLVHHLFQHCWATAHTWSEPKGREVIHAHKLLLQ